MIEIDKVVALSSGKPFEYSVSRHLYQDFVFEAVLLKNKLGKIIFQSLFLY